MSLSRKRKPLTRAVSELKDVDYSKEPELDVIYQRLINGREQFAKVFEKNIKAVMQISSLDLTMQRLMAYVARYQRLQRLFLEYHQKDSLLLAIIQITSMKNLPIILLIFPQKLKKYIRKLIPARKN